jgi:hypothetical protein
MNTEEKSKSTLSIIIGIVMLFVIACILIMNKIDTKYNTPKIENAIAAFNLQYKENVPIGAPEDAISYAEKLTKNGQLGQGTLNTLKDFKHELNDYIKNGKLNLTKTNKDE